MLLLWGQGPRRRKLSYQLETGTLISTFTWRLRSFNSYLISHRRFVVLNARLHVVLSLPFNNSCFKLVLISAAKMHRGLIIMSSVNSTASILFDNPLALFELQLPFFSLLRLPGKFWEVLTLEQRLSWISFPRGTSLYQIASFKSSISQNRFLQRPVLRLYVPAKQAKVKKVQPHALWTAAQSILRSILDRFWNTLYCDVAFKCRRRTFQVYSFPIRRLTTCNRPSRYNSRTVYRLQEDSV